MKKRLKKISQNDIRPDKFTEGKLAALKADLDWLISRKSEFVKVNCPACDSNLSKDSFEKYTFTFKECTNCKTVYMTPRANPNLMGEFYANSKLYEYWDKYIFPASATARKERIARPRVQKIISLCKAHDIPMSCLLEVGAGYGTFCEEALATKAFERVIAVEPGSALATSCRKAGIETIEAPIESVEELPVPPSVIVSFEVIEHLFSPEALLKNCYDKLSVNGMIVVTCPNFMGFDIHTLRELSDSTDAEHVNLFNPDSLSLLFERCGYEVIHLATPGFLDAELVREKVIKGEYNLNDQAFLQTVLIDKWDELGENFQTFLRENNLSSHLWMAGIKR